MYDTSENFGWVTKNGVSYYYEGSLRFPKPQQKHTKLLDALFHIKSENGLGWILTHQGLADVLDNCRFLGQFPKPKDLYLFFSLEMGDPLFYQEKTVRDGKAVFLLDLWKEPTVDVKELIERPLAMLARLSGTTVKQLSCAYADQELRIRAAQCHDLYYDVQSLVEPSMEVRPLKVVDPWV